MRGMGNGKRGGHPPACHARLDLAIRTESGRTVIIDHKSRAKFTDDEELTFTCGKQAMTYVKCYESRFGRMLTRYGSWRTRSRKTRTAPPS